MNEPIRTVSGLRPIHLEDLEYLAYSMWSTLTEIGANTRDPQLPSLLPTYQEVCRAYAVDLLGRKQGLGFVAERPGKPAGLIFGEAQPAWLPTVPGVQEGYIENIWVEPDQRRSGLSQRLVLRLEEAFRDKGVQQAALNFRLDNPMTRNFWEQMGYRFNGKYVCKTLS